MKYYLNWFIFISKVVKLCHTTWSEERGKNTFCLCYINTTMLIPWLQIPIKVRKCTDTLLCNIVIKLWHFLETFLLWDLNGLLCLLPNWTITNSKVCIFFPPENKGSNFCSTLCVSTFSGVVTYINHLLW